MGSWWAGSEATSGSTVEEASDPSVARLGLAGLAGVVGVVAALVLPTAKKPGEPSDELHEQEDEEAVLDTVGSAWSTAMGDESEETRKNAAEEEDERETEIDNADVEVEDEEDAEDEDEDDALGGLDLDDAKALPSGFEGRLTPQQSVALEELKAQLAESQYAEEIATHPDGDKFLLRFLRASMKSKNSKRIFNLPAAMARLEDTLEFRRAHGLDSPFDEVAPPKELDIFRQLIVSDWWADEKRNTLVVIQRFGFCFTFAKRGKHLSDEEMVRAIAYMNEETARNLAQFPQDIGMEVIVDLRGLGRGVFSRVSGCTLVARCTVRYSYGKEEKRVAMLTPLVSLFSRTAGPRPASGEHRLATLPGSNEPRHRRQRPILLLGRVEGHPENPGPADGQ